MPRRLRLTTLIVGLTILLVQMDALVLGVAIPTMAKDLEVSPLSLHLAISLYQLSLAIFIPASGWMAERFGSKRVFLTATVSFVLMSFACASAVSLWQLLISRSVQGVAGAFLMPVGRMTALRMAGKVHLVKAMVWVSIPVALGIALAPFVGGMLIYYVSWRWIFVVNVPLGLMVALLSRRYFRNYVAQHTPRFDWIGFVLLGVICICLLSFVGELSQILKQPAYPLLLLALIGLFSVAYIAHAKRSTMPLIPLGVFRPKSFWVTAVAAVPLRLGISSFAFTMPLMLQLLVGLNSLTTGLLMGCSAVGALLSRGFVHPLISHFGLRNLITPCSFMLTLLSFAAGLLLAMPSLPVFVVVIFLVGFTRSLQFTATNTASFAEIKPALLNAAVSFTSLHQQLSIALAVGFAAAVLHLRISFGDTPELTGVDFVLTGSISAACILLSGALFWLLPKELGKDVMASSSAEHKKPSDSF